MNRSETALGWTALLLATLLFTAVLAVCAPSQQSGTADLRFLDTNVPEFELRDETLVDGLWKLAKHPAPFAFGFESVLRESLTERSTQDRRLSVKLENKTVRQVLDALCQADPRFIWSMDGVTVNVFPRSISGNTSYLLNRRLETFQLKEATDVQDGLLAIARQLPPPSEQIANAQLGGDDPYPPKPWTVTYHNLTVRQVVNRLAAHGGACGIWIFGGSNDFRAFGFFNTFLRCPSQLAPDPSESAGPPVKDSGQQSISSPKRPR